MAIVRVQGNARGVNQVSNIISVTMSSTPINGNVLVAVIGTYSTADYRTVSSITQANVVWTQQVVKSSEADTYYQRIEIWFGVAAASASVDVSVNLNNYANRWAIADICEYSGVLTASFLDKTASNSGVSLNTDTGTTGATTQADELWIGGTLAVGSTSTQATPTNGFTLLDGAATSQDSLAFLEKIVSGTGTANSGTTISGVTNRAWTGVIATFKAAAATGGAAVQKRRLLLGVGLQVDVWNLNKHKLKFPRLTPKTF